MDSETARVEDSCVNGGASSNSAPVAAPAPGTSTVNEMLYLISLYLSEHTPCSGLSTQIVSELEKASLFGRTFTWDGKSRPSVIGELKDKYSNIKSDQLLSHLLRYKEHAKSVDPFSSGSLVAPIKDISDVPSLEDLVVCANKLIGLCRSKSPGAIEDEGAMEVVGEDSHSIDVEINECISSLAKVNFTSTYTLGSQIKCGLHLLAARSYGLSGSHAVNSAQLLRGSRGSNSSHSIHLKYKYNFHWRASGHISNPAYNVVFDRTGRYVITGADDALVKIWDVERGLLLRTLRGHKGCIAQLAVSPDNSMIASCCTMGVIRVWRLADGHCLTLLKTPGGGCVNWIMFDYASTALISVGDDGCCVVWDLFKLIVMDCVSDSDSSVLSIVRHSKTNCVSAPACDEENDPVNGANDSNETKSSCELGVSTIDRLKEASRDIVKSDPFCCDPDFLLAASNINPDRALPWTMRSSESSVPGHLLLEHFKETSYSDRRRIVALDICPSDRVVVTGCDDGLAQIWRYGEKLHGQDKMNVDPKVDTRYNKSFFENITEVMAETLSQSHRRSDESYVRSGLHVLCRLEGHLSAVMDVKFSHAGDRIVTGSMKDGTVRVWSFSKDFSQTEHIIIPLNDIEDASATANGFGGPFRGRQNRTSRMSKSQVYNLSWSCDDSYVFILQSVVQNNVGSGSRADQNTDIPTRLKQFDSMTGDLLNVINVSECRVDMVVAHPFNPQIVLTGGSEGLLVVWNLLDSVPICEHLINIEAPLTLEQVNSARDRNNNEPEEMVAVDIADMCFSEDGTKFAVTDSYGRVSVFGLGEISTRYEGKYADQYFSTDYHGVMFVTEMDPRGYDEGTMVPLNDCSPGLLCRVDGSPYEDQPSISLRFAGESWAETVRRVLDIIAGARVFEKSLERSFIAYKRLNKQKQLGGSSTQPASTRSAWGATGNNVRTIHSITSTRTAAQSAYSRLRGATEDGTGDDFATTMMYRSGRARRGVEASESSASDSDVEEFVPERTSRSQRAARRAGSRGSRRRYSVDSEESTEDDSNSGSDSSDEDQDGFDSDQSPIGVTRDMTSPNRRSKRARDTKPAASKKDSRKKSKPPKRDSSMLRPWGTLNGHRTVPVGEVIDRAWLQQEEPNDLQYCPQCGDHVVYFPQGHSEHLQEFPETTAPPWISFASKWPVIECRISRLSFEFPSHNEHNRCQSIVARIRLVVIGIPLKWTPGGSSGNSAHMFKEFGQLRSTRHSTAKNELEFDVSLRSGNAPDFIVPMYLYMRAAKVQWRPGMKFQTYFNEDSDGTGSTNVLSSPQGSTNSKNGSGPVVGAHSSRMVMYTGKIYRIGDSDPDEWPKSPWESLSVIWTVRNNEMVLWDETQDDSGATVDRISPWDAFVIEQTNLVGFGVAQLTRGVDATDSSSRSTSTQDCCDRLANDTRAAVLAEIDDILNGDRADEFAAFSAPVNPEFFPDYYSFVPVPIDLGMIRNRLENNFYRQNEALEFDISMLYSNCILYNHEEAPVVAVSRELMHILLLSSSGNMTGERIHAGDSLVGAVSPGMKVEDDDAPEEKTGLMLKLGGRARSNSSVSENGMVADLSMDVSNNTNAPSDVLGQEKVILTIPASSRVRRRDSSDDDDVSHRLPGDDENSSAMSSSQSEDASNDSEDSAAPTRSRKARSVGRSSSRPAKKKARVDMNTTTRPTRASRSRKSYNNNSDMSSSVDSDESDGDSVTDLPVRSSRIKTTKGPGVSAKSSKKSKGAEKKKAPTPQSKIEDGSSASSRPHPGEDLYDDVLWPSFDIIVGEDVWELFAHPVTDDIAPGYSKEISRPTDLSKIRLNLASRKYRTLSQYKEEMLRMFANCEKYNQPGSEFTEESIRLRNIFLNHV